MKKVFLRIGVFVMVSLFISCSNEEKSFKKEVEPLVLEYVNQYINEISERTNRRVSFKLDSISVMDSITRKKEIGIESLKLNREIDIMLVDIKKIKEQYEEKKELYVLYTSFGQNDAISKMTEKELGELKRKHESMMKDVKTLTKSFKEKLESMNKADSTNIKYYYILSHFKLIDEDNKKEEYMALPFYISEDFRIQKTPEELNH